MRARTCLACVRVWPNPLASHLRATRNFQLATTDSRPECFVYYVCTHLRRGERPRPEVCLREPPLHASQREPRAHVCHAVAEPPARHQVDVRPPGPIAAHT
eukprot:811476-Prorocentrum_minimum.AAC.1